MKKTILAAAVLSAAMSAHAGTTVFGTVEQRLEMNDGVWNVNGDDNFVGVSASEDLGDGASAYAVMSLDIATEGGSSTTRDAYVGLNFGGVAVQAGRQINLEKAAVSNVVDIFDGASFVSNNADWADSAVLVTAELGGVKLAGAAVTDNGGEDKVDAYEASATIAAGPVGLTGYYSKNQTTKDDVKAVAASVSVSDVALAGTYELNAADDYTATIVGSVDLGNNTLKGGYEKIENGVDSYIVEAAHNFSKNTAAYVNYSDDDADGSKATTMVGLRMNF